MLKGESESKVGERYGSRCTGNYWIQSRRYDGGIAVVSVVRSGGLDDGFGFAGCHGHGTFMAHDT